MLSKAARGVHYRLAEGLKDLTAQHDAVRKSCLDAVNQVENLRGSDEDPIAIFPNVSWKLLLPRTLR